MKKLLVSILALSALPVFAYTPVIPEIINLGTMQGHDMQSMEAQHFRMRELNDMKEVKEEKQRFEKETTVQEQPMIQKMINNTNSEFVEENGQIKIKYMN
jgi:hypothetical protein